MSIIIQGYQLRELVLGSQVVKSALAVPQDTLGTIATVSGGAVLVTSMLGLVSTSFTATVTSLSIGTHPTGSTSQPASIAVSTVVTSTPAASWLAPLPVAGLGGGSGSLVIGLVATVTFLPAAFVVPAGTITWTTTANNVGAAVTWYFTYIPLDTGASLS